MKLRTPKLERLGIDDRSWRELTRIFGRLFSSVASKPMVIDNTRSRKRDQRCYFPAKTRQIESIQAGCPTKLRLLIDPGEGDGDPDEHVGRHGQCVTVGTKLDDPLVLISAVENPRRRGSHPAIA